MGNVERTKGYSMQATQKSRFVRGFSQLHDIASFIALERSRLNPINNLECFETNLTQQDIVNK